MDNCSSTVAFLLSKLTFVSLIGEKAKCVEYCVVVIRSPEK
jgi:hypothetical protein